MNVTLLGNKIFADFVNLRWTLNSIRLTGTLIKGGGYEYRDKRKKMTMWRHRQRLELGFHEPKNTKDCWQPPEDRRGMENFFPSSFEETMALPTLWFLAPELWVNKFLSFEVTYFVAICYYSPSKLKHEEEKLNDKEVN